MGEVIRVPNGAAILLMPRSGSHSIAAGALHAYYPDLYAAWQACTTETHPAVYWPDYESFCGQTDLAVVVRNPVERFRSTIAHRHLDIDEQLANPSYGPLPAGPFARVFKFESGLDAVAEYIGLPVPLPQLDATDEADKPTLTAEQEARVREIYAADLALWESLG